MSHQAINNLLRLAALLGAGAALVLRADAPERNAWPIWVGHEDSWSAAGPFAFSRPDPDVGRASGVRPFFLKRTTPGGRLVEEDVLYPLFYYRIYADGYTWSLFQLIDRSGPLGGTPAGAKAKTGTYDVWPFYLSRDTGDPATSYRAFLPIAGTVKDRFGFDRLSFTLFPLYVRTERLGVSTTYTPFPFIHASRGAETGFAFWPLFGRGAGPRGARSFYALWPLYWNNVVPPGPDEPAGAAPTRELGLIPFYTYLRGPTVTHVCYFWPFLGSTDRTAPDRYREKRYFWPFLVQGRGDRYVDRWGPFYTHSLVLGVDKHWYLWPLLKTASWNGDGRDQSRVQVFYFLFSSLEQRKPGRPEAPPARKVQLWPLFSAWDDGGGHRQWEALSPFEPLFADNVQMRESWTPLLALVRHESWPDGGDRGSILWNAVTWESRPREGVREFNLGPLLSSESGPGGRRIALAGGLLGWERPPGAAHGRPFLVEFSRQRPNLAATSR